MCIPAVKTHEDLVELTENALNVFTLAIDDGCDHSSLFIFATASLTDDGRQK